MSYRITDDDDDDDGRARTRDAVSNGTRVLPTGVDGRSAPARRLRFLTEQLIADLPCEPDAAERLLVGRVAGMQVAAEQLEAKMAQGEDIDPDKLVRLHGSIS